MKCEHCNTTATVTTSCKCGRIKAERLAHFDGLSDALRKQQTREDFEKLFGYSFETDSDPGDVDGGSK